MGSNRYVQFDPAVIEQARQIDLLSYLQRYEPSNLKRVAGNVYCTREHDSLKISNGKWYWWSRGIGGYSALDYLMKVRELGFVEAVQTLTGDMGDWKPPPPAVKKDEPKVLLLPEKNADCDKVTEYLFGRGIDYQLIQDCIAEGIIFEGRKYHNAVFVGKDKNGTPKYAALRSTVGSSFKGDASGSDKRYSFRLLAREPTDKVTIRFILYVAIVISVLYMVKSLVGGLINYCRKNIFSNELNNIHKSPNGWNACCSGFYLCY